ncbi:hypothetical protein RB195_001030 [Necator americanus]|uniref:G-protein coupled receptors family 1 profile domain-containing protein n=1 Tax=Necator americanus TaxID=51031 RepID=A0ABR1DCE3_NECAM
MDNCTKGFHPYKARYRTCRTVPYILVAFSLSSAYSLSVTIWGYAAQDDEVIPFCNPPLGLAPNVSFYWSVSNIIINCCVLVVYAVIIGVVHFRTKSRTNKEQRKVLRRLRVIVVIFIFSWFMAILGVNVGYIFGFSPDLLSLWQSNMVFFALICYSQTFYVCIWRSKEYRLAFVEQLQLMVVRRLRRLVLLIVTAQHSSVKHVAPYALSNVQCP